jgi:hypothetical protein
MRSWKARESVSVNHYCNSYFDILKATSFCIRMLSLIKQTRIR